MTGKTAYCPGRACALLLILALLIPACSVEFDKVADRGAATDLDSACPDVAGTSRCPEAGACNDTGPCPACQDTGPCSDAKPCTKCPDAGSCADAAACKACPDAAAPDAKPPVNTLTDGTFADFSKGTLSESGAKIYVSAKGNVQLLDRLDLDGDGHLDIVFSSTGEGTPSKANARIYWGLPSKVVFSTSAVKELWLGFDAMGVSCGDLDDNGYPDLVFSARSDGKTSKANSYVYLGSKAGFLATKRDPLPTVAAHHSSIADLDRDGYLDIVFSNLMVDSKNRVLNSFIYWGSSTGFSLGSRTEVPTIGSVSNNVADLNRDGHLDIVFSSGSDGKNNQQNSYVYWGDGKRNGYSKTNRAGLPSSETYGSSVADLNGDGYLDVVLASYRGPGNPLHWESYVYWGTAKGTFSKSNRSTFKTVGAHDVSVADMDADGHLDILVSNNMNPKPGIQSFVYRGSTSKVFSAANRISLSTLGASGNLVADLDGDGYLDVVFANFYTKASSYIYWGSAAGLSNSNRLDLPTVMPSLTNVDPGSVYDRRPVQSFTSRVLDSGSSKPTFHQLSWTATVPKKTTLRFQLRSASTKAAVKSAKWRGPASTWDRYAKSGTPINTVHSGQRYIQYRATFTHDFGNTPVLNQVQITYNP